MKINGITKQKVYCILNLRELDKVREAAKELYSGYSGYKYIDLILGSPRGGLYKIQKSIFRKAFGNEKTFLEEEQ